MNVTAAQITRNLKFFQQLIQANNKETINAPQYRPFCEVNHRSPVVSHYKGTVMVMSWRVKNGDNYVNMNFLEHAFKYWLIR